MKQTAHNRVNILANREIEKCTPARGQAGLTPVPPYAFGSPFRACRSGLPLF